MFNAMQCAMYDIIEEECSAQLSAVHWKVYSVDVKDLIQIDCSPRDANDADGECTSWSRTTFRSGVFCSRLLSCVRPSLQYVS